MSSTPATTTRTTAPPINVLVGYVFGAVYLLVGLVGSAVTSGVGFASTDGKSLLGFQLNPLHDIVHLAVGAVLVLAARQGAGAARAVNTAVGGVYLLVAVLGLFVLDSSANILALNAADNVLHFASAAVLLGIGLAADRRVAR